MLSTSSVVSAIPASLSSWADYWLDAWQRSILFVDVLRERGNIYLDHAREGKPPVLVFDYEVLLDGRTLPQPANYALARIIPPADFPATEAHKRPFVVIDPRAGHGPGIGGFKFDSEIGIALRSGHPCYFLIFSPQPVPGQTIEAVARAEKAFLDEVNRRHPHADGKPFVIGNCQGGWALAMLASAAPDTVGPILLAGAPISYWAGVEGKNPMRYAGGLLGGSWAASFASDLGNGEFDGTYLVNNFEQLNPANTYWGKLYNLYANVDTERERFLEFERWWGGHFRLNRAEIDWIVQNLFIGNRLSAGEITDQKGDIRLDLRNIRSPIIVFASWGDNITPPQQALNWIPDLYGSVADIRAHGQTIVYCLHQSVGHLGIFVSGGVARKEHEQLAFTLDLIDVLPPGVYEAVITDTQPDMLGHEYVDGRYLVRFEAREVADILALDDGRDDEAAFEVVKRVAEANQRLYDTFISLWVRAASNSQTAAWLRLANPARQERLFFSDLNPAVAAIKPLADAVRRQRRNIGADNPLLRSEARSSDAIEDALNQYRDLRDTLQEQLFQSIYQSPWLARLVGVDLTAPHREGKHRTWQQDELLRLKRIELEHQLLQAARHASPLEAQLRALLYCARNAKVVDERPFNALRQVLRDAGLDREITLPRLKEAVKRQTLLILQHEDEALASLPTLLPDTAQRQRCVDLITRLAALQGPLRDEFKQRLDRVTAALGVNPATAAVQPTQLQPTPAQPDPVQPTPAPEAHLEPTPAPAAAKATRARKPAAPKAVASNAAEATTTENATPAPRKRPTRKPT
ncbi:Protein of unknown function [Andreprevotia lacus DSM 23236]|jgi:pimeloyl-ACP methyl ester carboxylesterase|uniref:Poly(3-hydroxyalkanoate) synthetase n=1 Tax=Andreprevotia lacus DSM 23236 TaxID=1121001 RepID=A0A1W1X9B6_9NEIS|nr:DUF3141 domain-containing protein [Andreprevotia lacus]SMC20433.1 Protein of unknown function [Andreprevotia lacus DSM 23236]